jgi:hypothetical protein
LALIPLSRFFNAKPAENTQRAQRYLYFISIFSKDRQRPLRVLWALGVKEKIFYRFGFDFFIKIF